MDREEAPYPRSCLVCRASMVGEKTEPGADGVGYHRFVCLWCGTVIDMRGPPPADERNE